MGVDEASVIPPPGLTERSVRPVEEAIAKRFAVRAVEVPTTDKVARVVEVPMRSDPVEVAKEK